MLYAEKCDLVEQEFNGGDPLPSRGQKENLLFQAVNKKKEIANVLQAFMIHFKMDLIDYSSSGASFTGHLKALCVLAELIEEDKRACFPGFGWLFTKPELLFYPDFSRVTRFHRQLLDTTSGYDVERALKQLKLHESHVDKSFTFLLQLAGATMNKRKKCLDYNGKSYRYAKSKSKGSQKALLLKAARLSSLPAEKGKLVFLFQAAFQLPATLHYYENDKEEEAIEQNITAHYQDACEFIEERDDRASWEHLNDVLPSNDEF